MAKFITPEGSILNKLNSRNARNLQKFQSVITWMLESDETYKSSRIIDTSNIHIPEGLECIFTPTSLTIRGLINDVDIYHPLLVRYLSKSFRLDGTEFKTENSDIKATLEDIKEQDMHYTGKSWGNKGIAGYYKDGNTLSFNFQVEITYEKLIINTPSSGSSGSSTPTKKILTLVGNFNIIVVPNMDPSIFCYKYGRDNGFTNELGEKINYDEYKRMMINKGFNFLTIDYSNA